ncbi:hypothetical protein AGMMS49592_3300 [Endomicrobiia bacterium]|nr:hypothetical protein AGMMS49592_3300 [Endomicrobiia bacterium]
MTTKPAPDSNKDSVTETVTEPKAEGSPLEKSVAPLTPAQAPAPTAELTPEPKLTADYVRKFLADHGGLEWLMPNGQDWLKSPGGQLWLNLEGDGKAWLRSDGGKAWLRPENDDGQTWLGWSSDGEEWLGSKDYGWEWLKRSWPNSLSPNGWWWLKLPDGKAWLRSNDGKEWLRSKDDG